MLRKYSLVLLLIIGILPANFSAAQLCSGSLGDPIVNNTFGNGTNPGPQLSTAATSYQYVSTDCPTDGFYTVRNNTFNCFSDTWHSLSIDHTGDANGYFMLVNASVQPGAFYIDTVRGLCAGTTFEFAAWVINMLKQTACSGSGITPNLTFLIERTDGMVIQSYSTGDITSLSSPLWKQYGFFFATPPGITDVVLRIINNAPGGCGNDLALDDITFRPCGPLLSPTIIGSSSGSVTICEGANTVINFASSISSGYSNPEFQWQESINGGVFVDIPGATAINYTRNIVAAMPGNYQFRLTVAEAGNLTNIGCRVVSSTLRLQVATLPVTSISIAGSLCEKSDLLLTATGGTQYDWNGPNSFVATGNPVLISNAQPLNSGKYFVIVENAAGCSNIDSVVVIVNPSPVASVLFTSNTICEGEMVQLSATGGGTYTWSPGTGLSTSNDPAPIASPSSTINYSVIVTNSFNCTDTAFSEVKVLKKPFANAGPDRGTSEGSPVQLLGSISGDDIRYFWSPPLYLNNTTDVQPLVTAPGGTYNYTLTVMSNVGCGTVFDDVNITVYNGIYIPTAFTPNNDGRNDRWQIPALSIFSEFQLSVFNRYGDIVFSTKNQQASWDGTHKGEQQPVGVYAYILSLNDNGEKLFYKGIITLIR